jgi:L-aminopeptidase/D-esterase-like protein
MKGFTDIPGIRVGHVSDYEAFTGCTAILVERGAVAGVDIRGSATGTQEIDTLSPLHVTPEIHGVCLAGGSAFGLEAASGIRRYLEAAGVGYPTGVAKVPIVPGAILYDLAIGKSNVRPTREMGEAAAKAANDGPVAEGSIGAGTGATVGKVNGIRNAMKGGIGTYTVSLGANILVSAIVAVNALGDVIDPETNRIIAGARRKPESKEFLDATKAIREGLRLKTPLPGNTTIGAVATNAKLTKPQATKLAQLAHHGLVRTISPAHTIFDGDTIFALSIGSETADFVTLGVAAAEAFAQAILRAVRAAKTLGNIPGLG